MGVRLHVSRPGYDQRHAVSAFEDVSFLAAIVQVCLVIPLGSLLRGPAGAVVRCKDNDRIVGDPGFFERTDNFPHGVIDLDDKVAVIPEFAAADELGSGHPWRVGCIQRHVQEEWLFGTGLRFFANESH